MWPAAGFMAAGSGSRETDTNERNPNLNLDLSRGNGDRLLTGGTPHTKRQRGFAVTS